MEHLFRHSVTVYNAVSKNEYNEETYTNPVIYNGRFHLIDKAVIDEKGESVKADAVVYLPSNVSIDINSKVDFNNQSYRVISLVESLDYSSKIHHFEVFLQRWQNAV